MSESIERLWGVYELPDDGRGIFQRAWWVKAPWAHPMWHTYVLLLMDLTTPTKEKTIKYRADVTHEMHVIACDPAKPIDKWPPAMLSPANYGYQFFAFNNDAAALRIENIVERIAAREVNPDTDARSQWARIFVDGVSLLASDHEPASSVRH